MVGYAVLVGGLQNFFCGSLKRYSKSAEEGEKKLRVIDHDFGSTTYFELRLMSFIFSWM